MISSISTYNNNPLNTNNTNRKSKPGWEIRLETQIRNLQESKMPRQKNNTRICWDEERKATQLEKKRNIGRY